MGISEELKNNLIADVENICNSALDEETISSLKRAFEITIGHAVSELSRPVAPVEANKKTAEEMERYYVERIKEIDSKYFCTQDNYHNRTDYKKRSKLDIELKSAYEDFLADIKKVIAQQSNLTDVETGCSEGISEGISEGLNGMQDTITTHDLKEIDEAREHGYNVIELTNKVEK